MRACMKMDSIRNTAYCTALPCDQGSKCKIAECEAYGLDLNDALNEELDDLWKRVETLEGRLK